MTPTSKNQNQASSSDCVVAPPIEGEFILQLDPSAKRDGLGNVKFRLYWFDPCTPAEGGPIDHTRGQVYNADPDDTIRRLYTDGARSIQVIHANPTWLAR
ncbi:hypothetical protein EV652_103375 [Kribbella steppae]|uniref:Uncharacterized protein n=1 Tax=Kribbella steppae TaxID=2512223 RepID=A0A4R2HQA8_9ACTN|nr:hypothetical protein [Kribbella steppae]TCO33374.1 hypothetical protein EV652_103375 [Kribbella steppae]